MHLRGKTLRRPEKALVGLYRHIIIKAKMKYAVWTSSFKRNSIRTRAKKYTSMYITTIGTAVVNAKHLSGQNITLV